MLAGEMRSEFARLHERLDDLHDRATSIAERDVETTAAG